MLINGRKDFLRHKPKKEAYGLRQATYTTSRQAVCSQLTSSHSPQQKQRQAHAARTVQGRMNEFHGVTIRVAMDRSVVRAANHSHAHIYTRDRTLVFASLSPVLTAVAALLAAGAAASLAFSAAPFSAAPAAAARALARSMKEPSEPIVLLQKAQRGKGEQRRTRQTNVVRKVAPSLN